MSRNTFVLIFCACVLALSLIAIRLYSEILESRWERQEKLETNTQIESESDQDPFDLTPQQKYDLLGKKLYSVHFHSEFNGEKWVTTGYDIREFVVYKISEDHVYYPSGNGMDNWAMYGNIYKFREQAEWAAEEFLEKEKIKERLINDK